jgi:DNA-binding GntR family transcriptional regulator
MAIRKKKSVLVAEVKQAVLANFSAGDDPLNEDKLAERFGVSRTPIRDALRELENEGFIERRQKKGIMLRRPTACEIADVYDVRASLECLAVQRAIERVTPKDIDSLRAIAEDYNRALVAGRYSKACDFDVRFHKKLIDLSENACLRKMISSMHILIDAFRVSLQLVPRPGLPSADTHEEIIAAIQRRDMAGATQLIHDHILATRDELLVLAKRSR